MVLTLLFFFEIYYTIIEFLFQAFQGNFLFFHFSLSIKTSSFMTARCRQESYENYFSAFSVCSP